MAGRRRETAGDLGAEDGRKLAAAPVSAVGDPKSSARAPRGLPSGCTH